MEAGGSPWSPDNYKLVHFPGKLNDNLVNSLGHKIMEMFSIQSCAVRPVLTVLQLIIMIKYKPAEL